MSHNRRLFLGGAVATFAASLVTPAMSAPILWGDGIHDDTDALNAWLADKPVRFAYDAKHRTRMGVDRQLEAGTFAISDAVHLSKSNTYIEDLTLVILPSFKGKQTIWAQNISDVWIGKLTFDTRQAPQWMLDKYPAFRGERIKRIKA